MSANKLALNVDKTKVMLITKKKHIKNEFEIKLAGKTIKHSTELKILGNTMSDELTWDRHIIR